MPDPFLLVVIDDEKREFVVEGPMMDDTPWINAIVAAQDKGRKVRCFNPGNMDALAAGRFGRYDLGYLEVGSVIRPKH
jgi:hypothetical protein